MNIDKVMLIYALTPLLVLAFLITLTNLPLARYYVEIVNRFLPNKGYKHFEKTKVIIIPFWKELINFMLNKLHRNRYYLKKYIVFRKTKITSFNNYDLSLMDGVMITVIKKKGGVNGVGFFKKVNIYIKENELDSFYFQSKYNTDNKQCIWCIQKQFDDDLLIRIFEDSVYWKPIFNSKYKNWEEFDKLFKVREIINEE